MHEYLDDNWLRAGALKRKSNYSPVIIFETTDPKRLEQMKRFVRSHEEFTNYEHVFVYDQWQGLLKLNDKGTWDVYKKPAGNSSLSRRVSGQEGIELANMRSSLREVDGFFKQGKTLFILQNLSESREWESGLQSALRSWAVDLDVISKGSTIFVQTADASSIVDKFTKELVVIITVDPASEDERKGILESVAKELEVKLTRNVISELVVSTAGLNLHQLESILLESFYTRGAFELGEIKKLKADLVKKSGVLEVKDPIFGFDDIGGYGASKQFVKRYIVNVLEESDRAMQFSLSLPKGVLLFGPPGTGKSLFAHALAKEVKLPFITLLTENVYSKWFGESGQNMSQAIKMAEKMSPAIVYVDEIDRFGRRGQGFGDSAGEESRRVFSQFLEWLGKPDREAIIVGTTNVPEHLDEAFIRTGRFDYKIPFLYPGDRARLEILLVHLGLKPGVRKKAVPLGTSEESFLDFLYDEIVPATQYFSGAEIEELVTRAKRIAFTLKANTLEPQHLQKAADTFRINRKERERSVSLYIKQAQEYTDDQMFLDEWIKEMGL